MDADWLVLRLACPDSNLIQEAAGHEGIPLLLVADYDHRSKLA